MEFKYTAKFEAKATFDFGKWKEAKASKQAFASLEDLRGLLPDDAEIADNPDLLYTSFNAAVVNLVNANGHAIDTETALMVAKYFVNRQANVEHSRWDIIGHIITQGFSTFGENKMITADKLAGVKEPFNICLGAVVYKIAREWMAEIIKESADKTSDYHEYISASWEIGFNDFDIILGSKKVSDAVIVTEQDKIDEYTPYLQMSGGDGFLPDGTPVYCLIKGDARPLGIGFTSNPAAAVKGVFVPEVEPKQDPKRDNASASENPDTTEELAEKIADIVEKRLSNASNLEKEKNLLKNNSQPEKNTVITNMKLKSINDLTPEFLQTAEASKEVRDFIAEALKAASDEYSENLEKVSKEKESFEKSEKETKAALEKVEKELKELNDKVEAKAKQETFNVRMDEISNEYELDEKQTKAIASQIKELTEESYKVWKEEFLIPFGKKKADASKAEDKKEDEKEEDASEALASATASKNNVTPPNALSSEKDEFAKMVEGISGFVKLRI